MDIVPLTPSDSIELGTAVLKRGGVFRFCVRGLCMAPIICRGDIITVEPVEGRRVRIGDVVLLKLGDGQIAVHRVVEKKNGRLVTQGDEANETDPPSALIVGRVVSSENPTGKKVFGGYKWGLSRSLHLILPRRNRLLRWMDRIIWGGFNYIPNVAEERLVGDILKNPDVPLPPETDWAKAAAFAAHQGIGGIVYAKMLDRKETVPQEAIETFKKPYIATLVRNERLRHALVRVFKSLCESDIEAVVFKGMALVGAAYKDFGLRPASDIDILVRRKDIQKIREICGPLGFVNYAAELTFSNEFMLATDNRIYLELRWDMTHYDRLRFLRQMTLDDIFNDSRRNEEGISVPSPEYQLLIAAFHVSVVHHFERTIWLYDIVAIAAMGVDWQKVVRIARDKNLRTALYYSIWRASAQFNVNLLVPEVVALKPSELRIQLINSFTTRGFKFIVELLLLDSFADVVRYIFGILYPSPDWISNHYQTTRLKFFFRLAHPFMLATRTLKTCMAVLTYVAFNKREKVRLG